MPDVAPHTVTGYVVGPGGVGLREARVIIDNAASALTDDTGRFRLDRIGPGGHRIRILRVGYHPVSHDFALAEGAGAAFVFRLVGDTTKLVHVCTTDLEPSVIVRVPAVGGAIVRVTHGDVVETYSLDELHDEPDKDGMRNVAAFYEVPGRFEVTVTAPGYRTWRRTVNVDRDFCHVHPQIVRVELQRTSEGPGAAHPAAF